jgi:hypothetical protein
MDNVVAKKTAGQQSPKLPTKLSYTGASIHNAKPTSTKSKADVRPPLLLDPWSPKLMANKISDDVMY